jgi:hypothetical protein
MSTFTEADHVVTGLTHSGTALDPDILPALLLAFVVLASCASIALTWSWLRRRQTEATMDLLPAPNPPEGFPLVRVAPSLPSSSAPENWERFMGRLRVALPGLGDVTHRSDTPRRPVPHPSRGFAVSADATLEIDPRTLADLCEQSDESEDPITVLIPPYPVSPSPDATVKTRTVVVIPDDEPPSTLRHREPPSLVRDLSRFLYGARRS